jgi:predicted nucleic acid-binding protein
VITAVDTNVLIDVLRPDPMFGPASAAALRDAIQGGALIACEVVWAEVGTRFATPSATHDAMGRLRVEFSAIGEHEALGAGAVWAEYRRRGGTRQRMVADFLVGAHARGRADRLLTRDRGFFRSYFADLEIVDPSAA